LIRAWKWRTTEDRLAAIKAHQGTLDQTEFLERSVDKFCDHLESTGAIPEPENARIKRYGTLKYVGSWYTSQERLDRMERNLGKLTKTEFMERAVDHYISILEQE
jgi:hypothetical protein